MSRTRKFVTRLDNAERGIVVSVIAILRTRGDQAVDILITTVKGLLEFPLASAHRSMLMIVDHQRYSLEDADGTVPPPMPGEKRMIVTGKKEGKVFYLRDRGEDWGG